MRAPVHVLAALKHCPHCPFLAKWSEHAEGIQRDAVFTIEQVDNWINSEPWKCHQDSCLETAMACVGQKLFKSGNLNITREELIKIWVEEKNPDEIC